MRLGSYDAKLMKNSMIQKIYGKNLIKKDIVIDMKSILTTWKNFRKKACFFQVCLQMGHFQRLLNSKTTHGSLVFNFILNLNLDL